MTYQYYFELRFFDSIQELSSSEIQTLHFVLTVIYQLSNLADNEMCLAQ